MAVQVIAVDLELLHHLSDRIRSAKAALHDDVGMFGDSNGVDHDELRRTLDEFDERWSDKRNQLVDALDKTGTAMRTIAESFGEADAELRTCIAGTAEGSTP